MKSKSGREKIVESIESQFIILTPEGEEMVATMELLNSGLLKSNPNLASLVHTELGGSQSNEELPSIKAMRSLELVDYEPASDKGHFRFYPKGSLMFDLLRMWAEEIAFERLEAYSIETPILYRWSEPDIRGQAESFHERHYIVRPPKDEGNEEFILRFAGDFGLFRIMRDAQLTYKHLPVRLFEFSPSFRFEQSGELKGLKRLRGFWMPDIHSFCIDLNQGMEEYKQLYYRYTDLANGTGVDYSIAFRIVKSFYDEHRDDIIEMAKYSGNPVFIELLSDMKHYWVLKHEMNTIDNLGGVCQVSTVQLDIKDASLYGINFTEADGKKKGCTIVHSSVGSIERWVFSILEDALKKTPPILPLWLSPIQVRILPVSEKYLDFCLKLAEEIRGNKVRIDIDDRTETLNWRIRAAEREWIPYLVICGDKEVKEGKLSVRIRSEGQRNMEVQELIRIIKEKTQNMPFKFFPGLLVSKRPIFRGRD
ncbi:MAG: threonine--tRNA ligase [Candidatus Moraniibacteriota bacterium]